jgi:PilZ domain
VLWWEITAGVRIDKPMQNRVMDKHDIASVRYPEERKHRRFALRCPVRVRFYFGNSVSVSELEAVSDNISLSGLLLQANSPIPQARKVSFTVMVRGHQTVGPSELTGEGEVVRVEPHRSGTGFAFAIECKSAMSALEHNIGILRLSRNLPA